MSEEKTKKCPKCGGEMEKGCLASAPYWKRGTNIAAIGLFMQRAFAYKCRDCVT